MNMKQQWSKDADSVAKYYTDKLAEKGYTVEALAARDEKYADTFFVELFSGHKINDNSSYLDIGSGLGLLIPFLGSRGVKLSDYLGVDLVPSFVGYSKNKYPDYDFVVGNFISDDFVINRKYDYVIALGVLVSRVSDYEEYLSDFINKMVKYSDKYAFFNLIIKVDDESPNYSNKNAIGGITPIEKSKLESILNKITGISYKIIERSIFEDATDAFVQIIKTKPQTPQQVFESLTKGLPRFDDGRINFHGVHKAPVINVVVYCDGEILIVRRSDKVSAYQGLWNGISRLY